MLPLVLDKLDQDPHPFDTQVRCYAEDRTVALCVSCGHASTSATLSVGDARRLTRWLLEWTAPLSEEDGKSTKVKP